MSPDRSDTRTMALSTKQTADAVLVIDTATGAEVSRHATADEAAAAIAARLLAEAKESRAGMGAEFAGTQPSKKDSGHDTPPKGYPTSRDAYADPVNYKYPLSTEAFTRAALSYWGKPANRREYSAAEQAFITARIQAAARKFGIDTAKMAGLTETKLVVVGPFVFGQGACGVAG